MSAIVLVLTLGPLILVVAALRQRLGVGHGLREALLVASTVWAALLVAFTELLSLGQLLAYGPVLACWTVSLLVLCAWVVAHRDLLRGWFWLDYPRGLWEWVLVLLGALPVAVAGAVAALTPPNNIDSLIYHLPRQVHWVQQASVAHFPPSNYNQIVMPPLAEFIGVHLMILSGGDGWTNLVQWSSLVLTMIAVSLIARDLGLNRAGQLLSALFVVTIPMAFLEALNTKNDLVVSFWLSSAAWWCVRLGTGKPWNLAQAILFGLSLGLLALTKGTGYYYAVPVVVVAGLATLVKQRRLFARTALLVATTALLVNAGHWARNYRLFHSITYPLVAAIHNNETHEPRAVVSNLIRNIALHLGTPSGAVNDRLTDGIAAVHRWLGIGLSDPRTTYYAEEFPFRVGPPTRDEDTAPAPVHTGLILLLTLALPFGRKSLNPAAWWYLSIPYACFLLFCLGVKWQPWHSRLHLPILCLFAVGLAGFCIRCLGPKLAVVLGAGCVAVLAPYATKGSPKPLLTDRSVFQQHRLGTRLTGWPAALKEVLGGVADDVAACHPRLVGLFDLQGPREYLIERSVWDVMRARPFFAVFQAMGDVPPSPALDPRNFEAPDVVVACDSDALTLVHPFTGTVYEAFAQHVPYLVYRPKSFAADSAIHDDRLVFLGWKAVSGWKAREGPYPQWDLPAIRWGLAPCSCLDFASDGQPMQLIVEGRADQWPDQLMTIRLNGTVVGQQQFDGSAEFTQLRLPLQPLAGNNQLAFTYRYSGTSSGEPLGVMFRKLVIVPLPPVHGSRTASSAP